MILNSWQWWNIVIYQSYGKYDELLKSNLCDYDDAYILVTRDITVVAAPATQVVHHSLNVLQK